MVKRWMKLLHGLDAVPIRELNGWNRGALHFVVLSDIPEPFRHQFRIALRGSGAPYIEGYDFAPDDCAYAQDWIDWASGTWRWGGSPEP